MKIHASAAKILFVISKISKRIWVRAFLYGLVGVVIALATNVYGTEGRFVLFLVTIAVIVLRSKPLVERGSEFAQGNRNYCDKSS